MLSGIWSSSFWIKTVGYLRSVRKEKESEMDKSIMLSLKIIFILWTFNALTAIIIN
jgi:hypothetical protein